MFTRQCLAGLCTIAMCCLLSLHVDVRAQRDSTSKTRIVLLGTGTPSPDPERSGPATAIVVNETPYLIDFGPGVVRRIAAASQMGVPGLSVLNIKHVFVTHLHSDHTAGYPDLILTPWSVGRTHALEVYGTREASTATDG
jgi:ribonuclease BN (tRNA processing enzyme)